MYAIRSYYDMRRMDGLNDRILGEETGKRWDAAQRQATDDHGPIGDGHIPAQPSHVTHVLLVVHSDDHRARGQEQQGFKEGMGHQVENAAGTDGFSYNFV